MLMVNTIKLYTAENYSITLTKIVLVTRILDNIVLMVLIVSPTRLKSSMK